MKAISRITDFKGIHKGEKIFILAPYPTLSEMNLEPIGGQIVLGLNRSALFYPDAYYQCTMDKDLLEKSPEIFKRASSYDALCAGNLCRGR